MKTEFEVIDGGAGVRIFDADTGALLAERSIVRDANGWRVAGQKYDGPQHETPRAAAQHFATIYHEGRSSTPESWADYMGFYVSRDDDDDSPTPELFVVRNRQGHVIAGGYPTHAAAESERQNRGDLERRQAEAGRTLPQ